MTWKHSDSISKFIPAFHAAQANVRVPEKSAYNPHLKNKYADLKAVWDACSDALHLNGISVMQCLGGDGQTVVCETVLLHDSGEWMSSQFTLKAADLKPQTMGSCASYARRYSLSAMVGVGHDEDDDAEAASKAPKKKAADETVTANSEAVANGMHPQTDQDERAQAKALFDELKVSDKELANKIKHEHGTNYGGMLAAFGAALANQEERDAAIARGEL